MAYSTPADVRQALVPGADGTAPGPQGTAASLSDGQINDSIAEADARVDSYLAQRYITPVQVDATTTKIPGVVRALSRDIACYLATLVYRKNKDLADIDPVARRYSDAMAFLTAVSRGQAVLSIPTNDNTGSSTGEAGAPVNPYFGTLFGAENLDLRPPLMDWPSIYPGRWL